MHAMTTTDLLALLSTVGLPQQLRGSIIQLFEAINQGHTAYPLDTPTADQWKETLSHSDLDQLFACHQSCLQIRRHFAQEQRIARQLKERASSKQMTIHLDPKQLMPKADESQQKAILGSASRSLSIVSGGPGTGKTSTAAAIVVAKQSRFQHPARVALVAPTGKAAVRLTESFRTAVSKIPDIDEEIGKLTATTIHRQLGQLDEIDIVLVDETSMVSLDLLDRLLKSVSERTDLVFMGDPNQLSSVEAGNILRVITESPTLKENCFELTHRHRISDRKILATLQDLCLTGNGSEFIEAIKDTDTFWEPGQHVNRLEDYVFNGLNRYFEDLRSMAMPEEPDFQCLTAISEGTGGRRFINHRVQAECQRLGLKGLGERLLVTENQPGIEVFNGDIGIVIETHDNRNPRVRFEHLDQPLLRNQLGSVEPAWAISIHRSQGSEYNSVLICLPEPLSDRSRFRPTRELLYTALTRAKDQVGLFATESMLEEAIANETQRFNCLEYFLNAS